MRFWFSFSLSLGDDNGGFRKRFQKWDLKSVDKSIIYWRFHQRFRAFRFSVDDKRKRIKKYAFSIANALV